MKKMLLKSMLVAGALTVGMSAFAQEDVTSLYLTNADLTSLEGWSYGDDGYNYTDWRTDGDVPVIEFYHTWSSNAGAAIGNTRNFHFTQTVTLPAGDYRIAVNAFYREGNGNGTNNDKAWIFAGEKKQNIFGLSSAGVAAYSGSNDLYKAANAFSKGDFSNAFDFTLESEQEIELGFRGYIDTYCSWCILGPVKLFKYSLEDYLVDYRAKVAEAQPLTTKPMNNEVRQALKDAMVEESTLSTSAQVADAIQALTTAIAAANNSIAAYARLFAALDKGMEAINNAIANGGAPTACETALDDIYSDYEEGLVADADIDAKILEISAIVASVVKQQTAEGADMTLAIINPSFETGNTNGWTYDASNDHGAKPNSNGTYTMSGCDGDYLFNIWSSGNAISQKIEGLPNGDYTLKAVIATDGGQKVQLNANTESIQIDAVDKGTGVEGSLPFKVIDGTATIGAEGVNKYWYKVDNFRLTFDKAISLDDYVNTLNEALAKANSLKESPMNAEVKQQLEEAISKAEAVDKTQIDAMQEAITALQEASAKAEASVKAYANAINYLPINKAELETTNLYTAEAYKENITDVEAALADGTLTDEKANSLTDVRIGWRAENYIDDILMSAWDANVMDWGTYHVNTWSVEGDSDGSEFKVPFIEYWVGDGDSLGEKVLTATLEGQEEGEYDVTATVRVRIKNGAEVPATGITMQVGDGEAVDVCGGAQIGTSQFYLSDVNVKGKVEADGVLTVKFNVAADNNVSWLAFRNIVFTCTPSTGISSVSNEQQLDGAVYNLAGQKVLKAQKGLYIVNGKKVVMK